MLMLVCLLVIIWVPRWGHAYIGPIPGLPALIETQLGSATVDGPRTSNEIGRRARLEMAILRKCTPKDFTQRGSAVLTFTIAEDGSVSDARIEENDLRGADAAACFERAVRGFKFDPLPEGKSGESRARLPIHQIP